jgi:hypothetical protein
MTATANLTAENLTIRISTPADDVALTRLAQLDSAAPLGSTPALVAEVDGALVAALQFDGGRAIANPFRHTAGIVALLEARAAEGKPAVPSGSRPGGLLRSLWVSPAGRA